MKCKFIKCFLGFVFCWIFFIEVFLMFWLFMVSELWLFIDIILLIFLKEVWCDVGNCYEIGNEVLILIVINW